MTSSMVSADAEQGRHYADKLVAVATRDGTETWALIHVEVQGDAERAFAERMYVYHYRLTDRYGVDVVSLAVLADDVAGFRPRAYHPGALGLPATTGHASRTRTRRRC